MKNACGQCGVGLACQECFRKVFWFTRTTRCDDWYAEHLVELCESFDGEACLGSIVVHAGEQDFASSTILTFPRPAVEILVGGLLSSMCMHQPLIEGLPSVDGKNNTLRSECFGEFVDQARTDDGR